MRVLLAVLAIGLGLTGPAWALSDSLIDYCLTTAQPKQCLVDVQRELAQQDLERQQAQWNQQAQLQRDLARQQAAGMAAFGSGNALINGMNQGMRQMQVHPYLLPPAQNYPTR